GFDDYPTCKEALPRLKLLFQADSAKSLNLLGSWIYGNKATSQQSFLNSSITSGYQKYANISQSASQITLQNMTINALRNGLADDAAVNNNTAAAFNYAYTQNKMQTTSMWAGMALQAREFLPMLQSILFLLFSSVAFLVVCIAMIPSFTFMVLGNYIKGFIYLGTWPVMFALINFIMSTRLSLNTTEIANIYGGITLSNVDALQEMHSRYAAMTGFLMMSVPTLIVPLIMKGGAAVMSSMSHQFAGMMSSVNARTSASAASGDINLGNAQVDNYSYNNTSGNKTDTMGVERIHGFTKQDATGFETTTFAGGKQVITGQSALSRNLPVNVAGSDTISNSFSQSASNALTASNMTSDQFSQAAATSANQSLSISKGFNQSSSYGSNSNTSESGNHRKSVSDLVNLVQSYADEKGKTFEEAWSDALKMNADAKMGVTVGTPGKGIFGFGASASTSTGVSVSADESDSTRLSDSERVSSSQSWQEQFSSSIDKVKSYSSGEQASNTHGKTDSEMESLVNSINQSESLAKTYQTQLSEAQSYTDAANSVKSGAITVGRDFTQDFVDYVGRERGNKGKDDAMEVIKGETEDNKGIRSELLAAFTSSPEVKAMAEQYRHNELPQSREDILLAKQQYSEAIDERKQQSAMYAPSPLNDSLYDHSQYQRIQGHAAQGNSEIMQDVWRGEDKHVPANLPTLDMEQAKTEAEAAHALIQPEAPQLGKAQSDDEKMAETVRKSNAFNSGPKM
ncbi:MAG: conjugal transfer protein TraG N-terminal domain-containing protein, partial [Shewanella sp.]